MQFPSIVCVVLLQLIQVSCLFFCYLEINLKALQNERLRNNICSIIIYFLFYILIAKYMMIFLLKHTSHFQIVMTSSLILI